MRGASARGSGPYRVGPLAPVPFSAAQLAELLVRLRRHYRSDLSQLGREARHRDPFRVLIATILSQRTRDEQTDEAMARLWPLARTPEAILGLPGARLEEAIRPSGFYRQKAASIRAVCRQILDGFGGRVPDRMEDLLRLRGVGRKTANCVLNYAYRKPAIAVDIHVHRISNRLGLVVTRTPEETERALMRIFPRRKWVGLNELFVLHGRKTCRPIRPLCAACPIAHLSAKRISRPGSRVLLLDT